MNNLLGITGGKSMGKDTVAKIINTLHQKQYKTKRFADPLKRFVADILGVSVEKLEDREFKEAPLGEEWKKYNFTVLVDNKAEKNFTFSSLTKEEGLDIVQNIIDKHSDYDSPFLDKDSEYQTYFYHSQILSPRLVMQFIGTEGARDLIHPNIWVNALFATYKPIGDNLLEGEVRKVREEDLIYPKWIIPDTRFDNEAQAIKDRGGIIIKVQRDVDTTDTHASEKGVSDKYVDIVIDNNGSMEDLVEEVKTILYAS